MSENTIPSDETTDVEAHKFAQNFETTKDDADVEAHRFKA